MAAGRQGSPEPLNRGGASSDARRRVVIPVVSLLVAAIALYVFLPGAVSVASSWRSLRDVDWLFAVLALGLQVVSWVWLWQLDRIALDHDGWLTVAATQLAGNALGRILPGAATPTSVALLREAGLDAGEAAAGLTASTLLQIGTALALPVLAVPALIAGAPVDRGLLEATYIALAVLVVLLIVGALAMQTDGLLVWVGRIVQSFLNVTVRRNDPVTRLPEELLRSRNFVRARTRGRWRSAVVAAAGNTLFDLLSLLAALRAVHADPRPSLVMLAYAAAEVLAQIPITPGGLGFVEAGLVGTLTLAGVPGGDALTATLLYRLVSYWIPIPVGGIAYLLFRRRFPTRDVQEPEPPEPGRV
jgi:uncharacterized protein (TIRG00374 family)